MIYKGTFLQRVYAAVMICVFVIALFAIISPVFVRAENDGVSNNASNIKANTAEYVSPEDTSANERDTAASSSEQEEKQGLSTRIAMFFADAMEGLPNELICFVVSMVPIVELRGGLVLASILDVPLWRAIIVCIVGNLIPVPFILWLITPIFNWLKKTKLFHKLVEKLEKKSMEKSDKIQQKQFWGLVIFVGIPIPGTGAWTGSLIASLLNVKFKKAFSAVCVGLLLATFIMCLISYGIPYIVGLF